jgi:hypothetical protein
MLLAAKRVGTLTVLLVIPAFLLIGFLAVAFRSGVNEMIDFRVFYDAARVYVHGGNPYPAHPGALTWEGTAQQSYAYPPLVAAAVIPLAQLPYHLAAIIWAVLSAIAVALALWLLDVRDWRCYGAIYLWPSTLTGISIGTISPLLLLGLALVWRFRDRMTVVSATAALTVSAKLFVWPVLVWLWLTGRRIAALVATAAAVVAVLVAWWWIGFAGIESYAALLRRLTEVEAPYGYAPAWHLAGVIGIAVVAVGCAAVAYLLRGRERQAFGAVALTSLLLTPILWLHYLVLLAAALPKRFSAVWLAPTVLWLTPQFSNGDAWRIALVTVVIMVVAFRSGYDRSDALIDGLAEPV